MKRIVLLFLILFTAFAVYYVISSGKDRVKQYNTLIEQAEMYREKKIYVDAMKCYLEAEEIYPDIYINEIRLATMYKEGGYTDLYFEKCQTLHEKYPDNEVCTRLLAECYAELNELDEEIAFLLAVKDKFPKESYYTERLESLKGSYKKISLGVQELSFMQNGQAIIGDGEKYGLSNSSGKVAFGPSYEYIGIFPISEDYPYAPVCKDGEYYYIDKSGNRKLVPDKSFEYMGSFSEFGYAPAKYDGAYVYMVSDFRRTIATWEYTSAFYGNEAAAVKRDGKWALLNTSLEEVTEYKYDEIKLDELDAALHEGIAIAKRNGKYLLLSSSGEELTDAVFDDVKPFREDGACTAAKHGALWGYINKAGEWIIEPKYEDADAFACGFAPVFNGETWNYIDELQNVVIEGEWEKAKPFNNKGLAAVYDGSWSYIQLRFINK